MRRSRGSPARTCRCRMRPILRSWHCHRWPRWSRPPRPFAIGEPMAGPREQPLPPDVIGREDATEVLRAFVLDGGLAIAFMRAFEEPDVWGLLLVDVARHAARAYARESDYSEEEALSRIVEMFEAELARPSDTGTTTPRTHK